MTCRSWLPAVPILLLAAQASAEIKTYRVDADSSTLFPADRRIYRGDCDASAVTPNAGDVTPDQCACTPNVNCAVGQVPDAECSGSDGRPDGGSIIAGGGGYAHCHGGIHDGGSCKGDSDCKGGTWIGVVYADGYCYPAQPPCFYHRVNYAPAPLAPCTRTHGAAVVNDNGNGTPTLVSLSLVSDFNDVIGATVASGIPGTTVAISSLTEIGPAPNQTGSGSSATSIQWGALTGWTQTGRLFCGTTCPGGCGGKSACTALGVVEGVGPPFPLKFSSFNTDPWIFANGGTTFTTLPFEIVSLGGGSITASTQLGGRLTQVPAVPLVALGSLLAGLAYLGARALRR